MTATIRGARLILDTNVYLDLADKDLAPRVVQVLEAAARRKPCPFWACDIVIGELAAHLPEAWSFRRYRSATRWMKTLCRGQLCDLWDWVIARAVRPDVDEQPAEARGVMLGELMGVLRCHTYGEYLRLEAKLGRSRAPQHVAKAKALGMAFGEMQRQGRFHSSEALEVLKSLPPLGGGAPFSDDTIRRNLREYLHWHEEFGRQARNTGATKYNFEKHPGDVMDSRLLGHAAGDFTVVTRDGPMREWLRSTKCPSPRLASLDEVVAALK